MFTLIGFHPVSLFPLDEAEPNLKTNQDIIHQLHQILFLIGL